MLDAILLERAGVPAVAVVTEPFQATGEAMAASWGMAGYRFLTTPHPIANLGDKDLDERAERLVAPVVALLQNA
ncbi:MAG TPA: hypothetical protein VLF19_07375 [Methylomirabilota bacterium]|nr:hypothetical protein [Methylomirabilota bacterium]